MTAIVLLAVEQFVVRLVCVTPVNKTVEWKSKWSSFVPLEIYSIDRILHHRKLLWLETSYQVDAMIFFFSLTLDRPLFSTIFFCLTWEAQTPTIDQLNRCSNRRFSVNDLFAEYLWIITLLFEFSTLLYKLRNIDWSRPKEHRWNHLKLISVPRKKKMMEKQWIRTYVSNQAYKTCRFDHLFDWCIIDWSKQIDRRKVDTEEREEREGKDIVTI